MDDVVVTGASGRLGAVLLPRLVAAGHTVRAVSRRPRSSADGATWAVADLRNGTGVREAVEDARVVVHCATTQRGDDDAAGRLISTLRDAAPSAHLVYVSIVGVERVPLQYYRTKLAVERAIAHSGVPFTILRATQFHSFVLAGLSAQRRLPLLLVPSRTPLQPVAVTEVAERLCELVAAPAAGRVDDVAGPEVLDATDLARRYLTITKRRTPIVPVHVPGRAGAALRAGGLTAPDRATGRMTFADHVATLDQL